MNVLIVGSGGREHAIACEIAKNPEVGKLYALPGNAGIAELAECADIRATDIPAIVEFARTHDVDFAIVAPDDPLALGAVDALHEAGIACFGPTKRAAIIEGSKAFSKDLMKKYRIPTAGYEVFDDEQAALDFLKTQKYPVVIKADGLALGKGVVIAERAEDATLAIHQMMSEGLFGKSGERIVIEEFLEGPEVSVLCFTDGHVVRPMVSSMDHKRAHDFDQGPNTGGMGVVAPNPFYTEAVADFCMEKIFIPTIEAMNAEGRPFKGCLYFGLMLTEDGPKVIEYNCRFGDPETQAVLPLMDSDLLTVMLAVESETLADMSVKFSDGASCCVIVASGGYPGPYKKGCPIDFNDAARRAKIYHSGTKLVNGRFVTNGGRVLGVTAIGENLAEAVARAYEAAEQIAFENCFYRTDIGKRALAAGRVSP